MSTPILATKLYIPPPRPNLVLRPRLIERLNEGLQRTASVTLISAPAGFGKTTLVGNWLDNLRFTSDDLRVEVTKESQIVNGKSKIENRVAWLSLDKDDSDLTRFLTYFIAALQQIETEIGQTAQNLLQSPQPSSPETLMTTLINDMATSPKEFVLVLDDYHLIDNQAIHQALTFLLDHLPPPLHLVFVSRADPPLPLSRLRARGQMTELREDDLRFTETEAEIFLNEAMQLRLSDAAVQALENRTEGWITGLQLAALSLQNRQDVEPFIESFSGSHRYILDYLADEVLNRESDLCNMPSRPY